MSTFLFDSTIFGPVKSRRLGVSLGINLLPDNCKVCNFNCIYCECGWTHSDDLSAGLPSRQDVKRFLEMKLKEMSNQGKPIEAITFAGNGEPTIHPEFSKIIGDTLLLRNKYYPSAKVAVLSNSMTLSNPDIRNALLRVDYNILKLDSGFDSTIELLNQPKRKVTVAEIVSNLKFFDGNFTLQTMFVRGEYRGQQIDNTTEQEICRWLDIVAELHPKDVMIYTIARETPINTLKKVTIEELNGIAKRVKDLGIEVLVSG
jgi:wyosine [tRNA(Phe)-imidazoG37] synthetase (radical SAM superfamily)